METTTTIKTMSLLQYVTNWMTSDWDWTHDSADAYAKDLIKNEKSKCMKEFEKISNTLCDDKNRMNQGVWKFISFENEVFTYSITK